MAFENIHFVINPAAGQPKPILRTLNNVLYSHDVHWSVSLTRGDGSGQIQAQEAIDAGADLIVAYGGDGTVKDVMNGLIGSDVPMAILHGGTGNALAYELDIPADLAQATALILSNHTIRGLDVGKVTLDDDSRDPGYFMLRTGVGLQTDIAASATREFKDRFGNLAYVMASLRSLAGSEPVEYHLSLDDEHVTVDGLLCMITNSASIGGPRSFRFAADVDPCDGVLDVFVLDASFEAVMSGILEADRALFVQRWKSRAITVETPSPLPVTLDGEDFGHTPFTVNVMPQAVQVLVPQSNSEGE